MEKMANGDLYFTPDGRLERQRYRYSTTIMIVDSESGTQLFQQTFPNVPLKIDDITRLTLFELPSYRDVNIIVMDMTTYTNDANKQPLQVLIRSDDDDDTRTVPMLFSERVPLDNAFYRTAKYQFSKFKRASFFITTIQ